VECAPQSRWASHGNRLPGHSLPFTQTERDNEEHANSRYDFVNPRTHSALRAIRSRIRGEQHLDAQAQQIADRMVEELRAAVVDLQETREDIRELAKQWVYPTAQAGAAGRWRNSLQNSERCWVGPSRGRVWIWFRWKI
jgi:predicted ArsR family transcriptional regulator